jgi:hypothetical protein
MQTSRINTASLHHPRAFALRSLRILAALLSLFVLVDGIASAQALATSSVTRQTLQQFGVSKRVKVRETDGTTVKGTVAGISDDSFLLVPKTGGAPFSINYAQVDKVQRDGMPKPVKVALLTFVGLIVLAYLAAFLAFHH